MASDRYEEELECCHSLRLGIPETSNTRWKQGKGSGWVLLQVFLTSKKTLLHTLVLCRQAFGRGKQNSRTGGITRQNLDGCIPLSSRHGQRRWERRGWNPKVRCYVSSTNTGIRCLGQ